MRWIVALIVLVAVVPAALSQTPAPAAAPARDTWAWPDTARNLKVLPKTTDARQLQTVMIGFTRSLGVRCTHCHVGQEGQPLSTYDFPSDKNPKKVVARGMLEMVGRINADVARLLPDAKQRVTVECVTCHRGVPRPRTLKDELLLVYDASGADSALARYRTLRAAHELSGAYDFREPSLNQLGLRAIEKGDGPGAIAVLQENVTRFPESGRLWVLLGRAYLAAHDTTQAVAAFEKAVTLDPSNPEPARALKELGRR